MTEKKKSKKGRAVIAVLAVALICAVGYFGYRVYVAASDDINGKNQPADEYTLVIEKQDFEPQVAQKLRENGIIINEILWQKWMQKNEPKFNYINGEYRLSADMTYKEIAEKLKNPDISHTTVKVTIPEGFNVMQIAERLEKKGVCKAEDFLEVCKSKEGFGYSFLESVPDSKLIAYQLEGFLFPATYDLALNSDPREAADAMLSAFEDRMTNDMTVFCDEHEMTLFQFITLASIVQEEALTNESAENIASVFLNRLANGTKLQSDVTYYYARDLRDTYGFSQKVYDAYYTYRCEGLPAGPITNSGESIIRSVIYSPETKYMYFFSDLQQEFHFAETYEEFLELQKKYPWKE